MFFAISFAIGITVIFAVFKTSGTIVAVVMGTVVIAIASALQYILIAEWHPMYLFKKHEKE